MATPLYTPPDGSPAWTGDPEDLLRDLNPSQREAVTAPAGPLLVVAGAGTGKTRVLTRRVAWRVATGAAPRSVLAITFTNKAADVLKSRLAGLPGGDGVVAGTFHSFCASVLRRHADRIGGDRSFTILDADDQRRLVRDLLESLGIDGKELPPAEFTAAISREKNGSPPKPVRCERDQRFQETLPRVREAYAARLRASALYDFDDLLLETCRLLTEVEDVRDALRARHRTVLVDEYQDTNPVQFRLVSALAGEERDVTVVGDPDQSIYRWRGATIRNVLSFQEDFPGARVVTLETNYRSTARILRAADAVIAKNRERFEKSLRPSKEAGEPLLDRRYVDGVDEAEGIATIVRRWILEGTPPSQIGLFFRVNHLTRGVETALRMTGVPYQVVSGVEFFERREVKDVLAYARLLVNPKDEAAFLRVVNVPRRKVGDASLKALLAHATAKGVSGPEVAHERIEGVSSAARKGLDAFLALLVRLRGLPKAPVAPLLSAIAEDSGYRAELLAREDDVERSRADNVTELENAAAEFDRDQPGSGLATFLTRAALVSDQDGLDEAGGKVSLMTVHAAKGLEFDRVVLVGAEEGWFPHSRSSASASDVEEERRLFYVALTRAKERLVVTHVAVRDAWRGVEARQPSRFWMDVPDELVTTVDSRGTWDRARARREARAVAEGSGEPDAEGAGEVAEGASRDSRAVFRLLKDPFAEEGSPPSPAPLAPGSRRPDRVRDGEAVYERSGDGVPAPGERVVHPHFGTGRMVAASGAGESLRVTVDFDSAGTKTILWTWARLTREGGGP